MIDLSPAEIRAALGAARAVASADGTYDDNERRLVAAAARALHHEGPIADVTPAEVAAAVTDPVKRLRLVQALILLAMIDGEVTDPEHAVIRDFAKELGVDEPRIANLKHLVQGHTRAMYFDLWRKSTYIGDAAKKAWKDKGLKGLYQFFGSITGVATDPEIAWRYKQLGLLPEGTFGRAYWVHMTERKFSFPGELRGFPEELAKHDLVHVLGDYNTDPEGECEVIGFIAGFMKHDPFGYLFMIFVHMQLGVNIFDGSPVEQMVVPTERVVAAIERGTNVSCDLYDPSWNYWEDLPLPLADVRRKYNIV